jgi:PAS domain S-box-containing protein
MTSGSMSGTPLETSELLRAEVLRSGGVQACYLELEQFFASLPCILIDLSPELRVRRWNPRAEEVLGKAFTEVVGRRLRDCRIGWEWERIRDGIRACRAQNIPVRIEDIVFQRSGGDEGYLGFTVHPRTDGGRRSIGYTLIGADITEKKMLESRLYQAQKLRSVGQLAAGIAHEINTPVQYVGDNTRFLQEVFEDVLRVLRGCRSLMSAVQDKRPTAEAVESLERLIAEAEIEYLESEIPEAIEETLEGIRRISKIVKALKEFSHPGCEEKSSVDINAALENTLTVARNEWKYIADVETDLSASLPLIPGYAAELNQVFLNMIINAAHAIEDVVDRESGQKGIIGIRTRLQDDAVEIEISDTGCGIPPEIQSRIFDPFFTTKGVGRGTGQGLAICYPVIVEKHGGQIVLDSEPGRGTIFRIRLPLVDSGN